MADHHLLVNLLDEPIEEGEFRTRNAPGREFRELLVDRGNQLITKVDIVGITHGEMADGENWATLLVFELRFVATSGRRFKSASVVFKFEDSKGQTNQDPVVHSMYPEGQWALNPTHTEKKVKYGANVGINAGIGPAGVEGGLLWEVEETKNRDFFTALTGVKRVIRSGYFGEANVVKWTLEENRDKRDGIPTFMRGAVLLKRPYDVPFTFTVKVKADVDFIGEVKTLFGWQETKDPIDPVEIDPGNLPKAGRSALKTLDPKLHKLEAMDNLNLKDAAEAMVVTVLDGGDLH
jgi:hypothetical protein